jgi:hypothetical protein
MADDQEVKKFTLVLIINYQLLFAKHLSSQNVWNFVLDANGYEPHVIAPEQDQGHLIESSLIYFLRPPPEAIGRLAHLYPFGIPAIG